MVAENAPLGVPDSEEPRFEFLLGDVLVGAKSEACLELPKVAAMAAVAGCAKGVMQRERRRWCGLDPWCSISMSKSKESPVCE